MPLQIESTAEGSVIHVKVVPNSSRSAIVGLLGDALKIKVASPPEAGQANKAIQTLLAQKFKIASKRVVIVAGQTQPHKRILLRGIALATVRSTLGV